MPEAPVTRHDVVVQVCHPPVGDTAQVPTRVPAKLSRCNSMLPPLPALATRAKNVDAPVPKLTPRIRIQQPLVMYPTSNPPSLHTSVLIPLWRAMVSASTRL